jgi:hypothetical protein
MQLFNGQPISGRTLATDPFTSPDAVIYIISSIRTMSSVELIQNAINFLRKLE